MAHFKAKSRRFAALLLSAGAMAVLALAAMNFLGFPFVALGGHLDTVYPLRVKLEPAAAPAVQTLGNGRAEPGDITEQDTIVADSAAEPEEIAALPHAQQLPTVLPASNGLLEVEFDLTPDEDGVASPAGQHFDIVKPLLVNGRKAGDIVVRVGHHSHLYLDRTALAGALGDLNGPVAERLGKGTHQFVSFAELRKSEIAVRYDPVADSVALESCTPTGDC